MGTKVGYSVYILCRYDNIYSKGDIIDVIMASTLESAIREAIKTKFFAGNGFINIISGDGQVAKVTIDKVIKQQ